MYSKAMNAEKYMVQNHPECIKIERDDAKIVECVKKGKFNHFVNDSESNSTL